LFVIRGLIPTAGIYDSDVIGVRSLPSIL
jgi:hypothetical protein